MITLFRIAWRNAFRNKRRTVIIVTAVGIGVFGLLATAALYNGMLDGMISSVIRSQIGHVQVHRAGFNENPVIELSMDPVPELLRWLDDRSDIAAWAPRVRVSGLVTNPEHSTGVQINGVDPSREGGVTIIKESLAEGTYLQEDRGTVLVGKTLAEDFGLTLGNKVVLMAQDRNQDIGSGAFRVEGIFQTGMSDFDRTQVFITIPAAQELLALGSQISEVVIIASGGERVDTLVGMLRTLLDPERFEVLSWQEVMPILMVMVKLFHQSLYLIYLIIFIAVALGVINTMVMIILERTREFGILLAMGIRPSGVVFMVVLEAIGIGLMALAAGNLIGIVLAWILGSAGIDLSYFSEGMEYWRIGRVIYPRLGLGDLLQVDILTLFIAALVTLYPAFRAARLHPAVALRHH